MKKMFALVLALMMLFSVTAFAEEATVLPAEELFEGVWVQFPDGGFELYMPADWYSFDVTEDMMAKGIFFLAGTEDLSYSCTLAWTPFEAECTIEELYAEIVANEPEATLNVVNGVGLIVYADDANNLLNFVALDGIDTGAYLFAFNPPTDENFVVLAALIASTIRNIQ